jgi:hypothetical protein
MKAVGKLIARFRPRPKAPEDLEAERDGKDIQEEMKTTRLRQRWFSGGNLFGR